MSGGEKARLVLAMMVCNAPTRCCWTSRPTTWIWRRVREALAVALNEFEGTLMLVSHDRALLLACDEFWLVGRGVVGRGLRRGDLDDYQRHLLDEAKRQRELAKQAAGAASRHPRRRRSRRLRLWRPRGRRPMATAAPSASAGAQERRQQRAEQTRPLRKEASIDARLTSAGAEKSALEARLAQPLPGTRDRRRWPQASSCWATRSKPWRNAG